MVSTLYSNLTNDDILGYSNLKTKIPNGSDFNDYKTPGVYYVESDASGATMVNIPRKSSGKLIVMARHTIGYLAQYYYPSTGDFIRYIRKFGANSWGDWITEEINPYNTCPKQFSLGNLSSASDKTFEDLGLTSYQYGAYFIVARSDGAPDGTYVGVLRHNAAGYQITDIYKGQASTTPYFTADGIAKVDSSNAVSCAAIVHPILVWGNRI